MLRLKDLSKYYHDNGQVVKALDGIDLSFESREFVVITGESGSGKSTLLNVISGLDSYEAGELFFYGNETSHYTQTDWERYRKENIGFIFQNYNLIDAYTVYQNIEIAALIKGEDKEITKRKVLNLIEKVGLKGQEKQKASTLSGGEKQRVAIARALAKDAPVIIADEPTGNLDSKTSKQIMELLKTISQDKLVLLVSHSFEATKAYATRHVRIADGEITLDKVLTKTEKDTTTPSPTKTKELGLLDLLRLGLKNILATPKKTVFTLLVSLFVVAVFALIYGAYVHQTNTPPSGGSFENPHRLILTKTGETAFTSDELEAFSEMNHVLDVVETDPIFDLYGYLVLDERGMTPFFQVNVNHAAALTRRDLSEGRLPQASDEIVIRSREEIAVGETFEINYEFGRYGDIDAAATTHTFTVVGTIETNEWGSPIFYHHTDFFTDPLIRAYGLYYAQNDRFYRINDNTVPFNSLIITESVAEGTIHLPQRLIDQFGFSDPNNTISEGDTIEIGIVERLSDEILNVELEIDTIYSGNDEFRGDGKIHPATLIALFEAFETRQISLVVADNFAANAITDTLDRETYNTLYLAGINLYSDPVLRAIGNLMLGILSIIVLFVMYFIAYLSLKNIMEAKRKDYVILRALGLYKKDLNLLSTIEVMILMLLAIVLVFTLLVLNTEFIFLPNYLRYYQIGNYIFMFTAIMVLSLFLAMRFNRRLFTQSVITAFKDQG